MNTVISLDGVLRSTTGELIFGGLSVYRAFKSIGRVTLITSLHRTPADSWCMTNNLTDYDEMLDASAEIDPDEPIRSRQLAVIRSRGRIDQFIDADPTAVAEGLRLGITSLLFTAPSYTRPEFQPDARRTVRPWGEVVAEKTRQQAMIAADSRLFDDDPGRYE